VIVFVSGSLFVAETAFQLVPLPARALKTISPKTSELYEFCLSEQRQSIGTHRGAATSTSRLSNRPLSIYPHATRDELLKGLAYAGVFLLVVFKLGNRRQLKRIWVAIALTGFALALEGIVQKATSPHRIYWFWRSKHGGNSFGPYVNRNHFAGYMDMAVPLVLALGLYERFRRVRREEPEGTETNSHLPRGLWITMAVTMGVATMLSLSRGGMVSMAFALAFMAAIRHRVGRAWIVGAFVCIVLASFSLKWEPLSNRLATLLHLGGKEAGQWRMEAGREALRIWRDFPVVGTGLGTFSSIDRKYRQEPTWVRRQYVEVDWLQLVSEMGASGIVSVATFLGGVFALGLLRHRRGHASFIDMLLSGGCTSMVAILIHSWGDFNLHIPANAFLFAVILGMIVAATRVRAREMFDRLTSIHMENQRLRAGGSGPADLVHGHSWLTQCCVILLALAVMGVAFWDGRIALRAYRAHRAYTAFERSPSGQTSLCRQVAWLHMATVLDPTNSTYWYVLGTTYEQAMRAKGKEGERTRIRILEREEGWFRSAQATESPFAWAEHSGSATDTRTALFCLSVASHRRAIDCEPALVDSHHSLAWLYGWAVANGMEAYRPLIETEFGKAIALWPRNPYLRYNVGTYYARHWKKSLAINAYRASIRLSSQCFSRILGELWNRHYATEQFRWVVGERPSNRLRLADFYIAKGRPDLARQELALVEADVDKGDARLKASYLRKLLQIKESDRFERLGRRWAEASSDREISGILADGLLICGKYEAAMSIYRDLIAEEPTKADLWYKLAGAYVKLKGYSDAENAYKRAVAIAPRSTKFRDALGLYYLRRGDALAAIAVYEAGCMIDPTSPHWHYRLGQCFERARNYVRAIDCYQKAVELAPGRASYAKALRVAEKKLDMINATIAAEEEARNKAR